MKRRILGKTTKFHAFFTKKKNNKNENETVSFLSDTVSSSSSFGRATGEEKFFVFFPLLLPLPLRALLKPKPDAPRTSS
jgi:hypothetical protein